MKRITLIFIVLLMAIAFIYADGGSSAEQAEHWEKVRQLDQLAERFKEDTGFTGEVAHSLNTMRLHVYRGSFSDIPFSADADTTAFRQACERIVEKLLPYSPANRMQLSMCRIGTQLNGYTTDYMQQVNGYRLEGSGFIMITYDAGCKRFSIGDNTVDLPFDNISPVLSYEDAVRIYDEHIVDDEVTKNIRKTTPFLGISFCNISASESADIMPVYRLCWVGGWYKKIYIDALTGKIYKIIDNKSDDRMIIVSAHVMPYSDNIGSFLTTVVSLDSTEVTANCDGVPSEIRYTNGEGSILLLGNEITDIESCLMASCGIKVFKKSGGWVKHNSLITDLPSLVFNYTDTDSVPTGNPSNLYYSALRFRDKIKELMVLNGSSCYYGST